MKSFTRPHIHTQSKHESRRIAIREQAPQFMISMFATLQEVGGMANACTRNGDWEAPAPRGYQ